MAASHPWPFRSTYDTFHPRVTYPQPPLSRCSKSGTVYLPNLPRHSQVGRICPTANVETGQTSNASHNAHQNTLSILLPYLVYSLWLPPSLLLNSLLVKRLADPSHFRVSSHLSCKPSSPSLCTPLPRLRATPALRAKFVGKVDLPECKLPFLALPTPIYFFLQAKSHY